MFSLIVWYLKQCYVNYFVTAISSIHNLSRTNYIMYFIHKKRIILYIYCCFTKLFLQFCKVLSHCQCLLLILYLCLSAGDGISSHFLLFMTTNFTIDCPIWTWTFILTTVVFLNWVTACNVGWSMTQIHLSRLYINKLGLVAKWGVL